MRRVLFWLTVLVGLAVGAALTGLGLAQRSIRALAPELPATQQVVRVPAGDLPSRLTFVNTARQHAPRSSVLDVGLDPEPDAAYVMGHPAFVLEWPDGRIFLIDVGMTREAAEAFGGPIELVGGEPIEPLGSTTEQLGADAARVAGIAFTHLHPDHTEGIRALCGALEGALPVFQSSLQLSRRNYTTDASRAQLAAAPCLERRDLGEGSFLAVPGFPGLFVIPVAGHTPGSQIFVAHVRATPEVETWVFAGDVVNQLEGARSNIGKPTLYRWFVVPESPEQLARARIFLRDLELDHGARLLVSHDLLELQRSGLSSWERSR